MRFTRCLRSLGIALLSRYVLSFSSTANCPFSGVFPRYRIDLSTTDSVTPKKGFSLPFLSELSKVSARSKIEKLSKNSQLEWMEQASGLEAFTFLWSSAAAMLREETRKDDKIMAFPDTDKEVVAHWVDIFKWLQNELSEDSCQPLKATILGDCDVPAIRLSRDITDVMIPIDRQSDSTSDFPLSVLTQRTQAWVKRILIDQGICPFTKSTKMSGQGLGDLGVPVGSIAYHSSNAGTKDVCQLMADTFVAIEQMIDKGPAGKEGVSSILLAAPKFDQDFPLWSGPVFAVLEASVVAARAEAQVGVVCFHPRYLTPDGSSWPGFGHMHSLPRLKNWLLEGNPDSNLSDSEIAAGGAWQRRTPHATINVLRADQLEIAERRRTTENLYSSNICKLVGEDGIGLEQLQNDLDREQNIQ